MTAIQSERYEVISFYKFVSLPDAREVRKRILNACSANRARGTVLIAEEGINGTLSARPEQIAAIEQAIRMDSRFRDIEVKRSEADVLPFKRLRVKVKDEIVSLRSPDSDPREQVGEYVDPEDWDDLIRDPDVLLIDTRNDFEVQIGTFEGAVNPGTESFSDFPDFVKGQLDPSVHRRVAMFCTGGIRCEKATSFLLRQGFSEVYHLKGGILNYLERIPEERSNWRGECFVFDDRVTVDHRLQQGGYVLCYSCHAPVSSEEQRSPVYRRGVSCPACHDRLTPEKRRSAEERQRQIELAELRGYEHLGPDAVTGK